MAKKVPIAVIRRLPRYFRYITKLFEKNTAKISSQSLADDMQITASQIRQDFNHFGGFGQQGYGYNVTTLRQEISQILGVNEQFTAVIIGIGNLGNAIANNVNFAKRGVKVLALFDSDSGKIGKKCGEHVIKDVNLIGDFCKETLPDIAILTVPSVAVPEMFFKLKELGIKGFWNFSSAELKTGNGAVVENVHLGDGLMLLTYSLRELKEEEK